jgi:hypothetical protein
VCVRARVVKRVVLKVLHWQGLEIDCHVCCSLDCLMTAVKFVFDRSPAKMSCVGDN